jgi:hypothetical protein
MSNGKELNLRVWRDFRDSIVDLDKNQKIESINRFWMLHPFKTRTIDPDDTSTWMSPWDMVYHDQICEYSRAIMIHQTLLLMIDDAEESYLIYTLDTEKHQDYMLVVFDGLVMNHSMDIVELKAISSQLSIQSKYKSNKKGIYTIM